MSLCVNAKQPLQAQVEMIYKNSITYDFYFSTVGNYSEPVVLDIGERLAVSYATIVLHYDNLQHTLSAASYFWSLSLCLRLESASMRIFIHKIRNNHTVMW
jgi:hypothetical protein